MSPTCPVCGKAQVRRHRHGERRLAYERFLAEQERGWIRELLRRARSPESLRDDTSGIHA